MRLKTNGKILLLDLLKVLQKHSDEYHPIDQKNIINILEKEYGYENLYPKRQTVKNNIEKLLKYSERTDIDVNEIDYKTNVRKNIDKKTGKEKVAYEHTDFSYIHDFTYGELRLIIDSILFSKQIPSHHKEGLIKKLEGLSSEYFNSRLNHIRTLSSDGPINHDLFRNIEDIDKAISQSRQVTFKYNHYTVDKNNKLVLQSRTNEKGIEREYVINPYQMVATNGRYYLICNNDSYDNLSHYRLDRMTNIEVLNKERKPLRKLKGVGDRLDLAQYMAEHIYMYQGESTSVKLRLKKDTISDFIDWFGTDHVDFSNQTADEVTARVRVNRESMRKWALQYGLHVKVLSPSDLVEQIKEDIKKVMKNYE